MVFIIGVLAEIILFWVILSPETSKEIAIFALLSYLAISLDISVNLIRKVSLNLGVNILIDSMKPWDNIVSCIVGIALWTFISPEGLLGAVLFLVLWLGSQFLFGLIWGNLIK